MRYLQKKRRKSLACLLAALCLLQNIPVTAFADTDDAVTDTAEENTDGTETANPDAAAWVTRTETDVLAKMRLVSENDNLAFYAWDEEQLGEDETAEDVFALVNKKNGYIWWSSPINAGGDKIATRVLSKELQSAAVLTAAEPNSRSTVKYRSGDSTKCGIVTKDIANGVQVTYNFRKAGIKIPVCYTLCEDYLNVTIDSEKITEKYGEESEDSDKCIITQSLALLNAFGAADSAEEGYFVIPDGCGALIHFNNRKYTAKTYSQLIYGEDTTAVPKTKGPVTEGVSLPMYGICKGENAMLAVAAGGDGNCLLNADVSGTGQSNTEYNRCYFQFVLRAEDSYYLGGDSAGDALDVYEKQMEPTKIDVRYYPLCAADEVNADGGEILDTADIAAKYRSYLLNEENVPVTAKANDSSLYVDIYGGCKQKKNILGFPIFCKTAMTSYAQTQEILEQLKTAGASDLTLTLNNWTDAGISGKVDCKAKPSATLGGKDDFADLTAYLEADGIEWYPSVSNSAFYSGGGYFALRDTAVRVSGSFARIVDYERAYGVPYGEKKTMSLLSPSTFAELYGKLADNYRNGGLHSVCIGELSQKLYGDYGKKSAVSREQTAEILADSLKTMQEEVGAVLSKHPNAYVLPYTDTITNLPLSSSGFNLFDEEVPLYQMVMHGVMPYASEAVNGSADAAEMVLRCAAVGSNLHYDMLYADTSELKDTDFDIYFYANYANWVQTAAADYQFLKPLLESVSDSYIISYREENRILTTRYANGVETVVDLDGGTITYGGETIRLPNAETEGDAGFGGTNQTETDDSAAQTAPDL